MALKRKDGYIKKIMGLTIQKENNKDIGIGDNAIGLAIFTWLKANQYFMTYLFDRSSSLWENQDSTQTVSMVPDFLSSDCIKMKLFFFLLNVFIYIRM